MLNDDRPEWLMPVMTASSDPRIHYTEKLWKGVKQIFICARCGQSLSSEDDMILHVVAYYPEGLQSDLLDELVKAKDLKETKK
jgi:hypothetical protein